MEFSIRQAKPADADTIAEFNFAMARETENLDLNKKTALLGTQAILDRPEHGSYILAVSLHPDSKGEVAGCLMITTEWSDFRNGFFWWVQSVYVKPDFRRMGVYRALYDHTRAAAKAQPDVVGIRLYVERDNDGAREVYEKLGMGETAYRLYEEPL